MVEYTNEPLQRYLDDLGSKHETPGGGSVSGLVAALAAGLGSMVCHFTIGKKKYAEYEAELRDVLKNCDQARNELLALMQEDITVFEGRMTPAYNLPKDTEDQAAARKAAIQDACKAAAQPPMQIARTCHKLLEWMIVLSEKGSVLLVSDVGCAASFARAACEAACMNVRINLKFIDDTAFVEPLASEVDSLVNGATVLAAKSIKRVEEKLAGN